MWRVGRGRGRSFACTFLPLPYQTDKRNHFQSLCWPGGGETVLLVEEDEIERKLAKSVLQRHRYHVLEAASPVEALMLTQQYQGIVHLTVSPLVMPEIGGRELARRLLDLQPTMKALFLSSYDDETIRQHRINQQFVLQQPYRQTGLIGKVREMLDAA